MKNSKDTKSRPRTELFMKKKWQKKICQWDISKEPRETEPHRSQRIRQLPVGSDEDCLIPALSTLSPEALRGHQRP